jgi:hypothetical protein
VDVIVHFILEPPFDFPDISKPILGPDLGAQPKNLL